MAQHASVQRGKSRPYRPSIGATSFDIGSSPSKVHESSKFSSRRHESPVVVLETPEVKHVIVVLIFI